ncbi:MAG: hypothetical protein EOO90_14580 [Pedobacter sp.]|nr:MAG: hypothetical protein EOO90_14580 [Pedobacter sp.]
MNYIKKFLAVVALGLSLLSLDACKSGNKDKPAADTVVTDTQPTAPEPVAISEDEELMSKVKDATKDFPGVEAKVSGGEITLTGTITRDTLPKLMQSLSALHAKKINNQLTITK